MWVGSSQRGGGTLEREPAISVSGTNAYAEDQALW
jgi:hypothetical protein